MNQIYETTCMHCASCQTICYQPIFDKDTSFAVIITDQRVAKWSPQVQLCVKEKQGESSELILTSMPVDLGVK